MLLLIILILVLYADYIYFKQCFLLIDTLGPVYAQTSPLRKYIRNFHQKLNNISHAIKLI